MGSLTPQDFKIAIVFPLPSIAKHFHTTAASLAASNKLTLTKKLVPGKTLVIPTHTNSLASNKRNTASKDNDKVYQVRKGDTISKIAKRFKTSAAAIRLANLVDDDSLHAGLKIIIPSHFSG